MKHIRDTLLRSLFLDTPPFSGELLVENMSRVFPGKDDFVRFLQESDSQKRTSLAATLLCRLARESGIVFPTQYLDLLLKAEEQFAPEVASRTYVAQDHFVHLINVYLLGVYVFTHHKKFNRTLRRHFERLRQNGNPKSSLSSDDASFADFVFSWRTFVLLHDLGYPHELPLLTRKGPHSKQLKGIRARHAEVYEEIVDEVAISFLARISALHLVDQSHSPVAFDVAFPDALKRHFVIDRPTSSMLPGFDWFESLSEPDLLRWAKSKKLPMLHGRRFLTLANVICPKDETLAVLVHKRSGKVVLLLIPDGEKGHREVHSTEQFKRSSVSLAKHAFELGTTPRSESRQLEYEWHRFSLRYEDSKLEFFGDLERLANRHLTADWISKVCDELTRESPAPIATITSDADLRTFEQWAHNWISNWWKLNRKQHNPALSDVHQAVDSVARSPGQSIADSIAAHLRDRVENHVASLDILKQGFDTIVENVLSQLSAVKTDLVSKISEDLRNEMQDRISKELARERLLEDLRGIAKQAIPNVLSKSRRRAKWKLDVELTGLEEQADSLDASLKQSTLPGIRELLKSYRPSFLGSECHDHGLASAVIALKLGKLMVSIARAQEDEIMPSRSALARLVRISLRIGDETTAEDVNYRSAILMNEVSHAIAMHNLYPIYLKGNTTFRVNLTREPFCYFAMLMDALQNWDRDKRLWQNTSDLPYKTTGEKVDIHIVGDVIHIQEHDFGLDIERRADSIKNGLDSYLKGASHFIWLDLGQWGELP